MNRAKVSSFLTQGAEVAVLFMAFAIPISKAMVNVAFGFLIFFWLCKKVINKDFTVPKTPLSILFLLLLFITALSMVNTISVKSSIGGLTKILKQIVLFFAIVETLNERRAIKLAIFGLIAGCALATVDGIWQFLSGRDFIRGNSLPEGLKNSFGENRPRISASTSGPIWFGSYLVSVIPLLVSLFLYSAKKYLKLILGILLFGALFCLVNTHARGPALGLALSLVMFAVIKRDFRFIILLLALFLSAFFILPKTVIDWTLGNFNLLDFFVEKGGRRLHWQAALNMIKTHPLVGVGTNTFSLNYVKFRIAGDNFTGWYAHNSYLHMAAEIGLTGVLIFLSMIVAVFKKAGGLFSSKENNLFESLRIGLYIGLAAYLAAALQDSILQSSNLTVLFWLLVSFLLSVNKIIGRELELNGGVR